MSLAVKKKTNRPFVAFLLGFFALCALPVLAMPIAGSATSSEGRTLSSLPQPVKDGVWNEDFGTEFETYLGEHFAGREQLVTLHAQLIGALTGTSAESKVILGREGWLFYTPNKNSLYGQYMPYFNVPANPQGGTHVWCTLSNGNIVDACNGYFNITPAQMVAKGFTW